MLALTILPRTNAMGTMAQRSAGCAEDDWTAQQQRSVLWLASGATIRGRARQRYGSRRCTIEMHGCFARIRSAFMPPRNTVRRGSQPVPRVQRAYEMTRQRLTILRASLAEKEGRPARSKSFVNESHALLENRIPNIHRNVSFETIDSLIE